MMIQGVRKAPPPLCVLKASSKEESSSGQYLKDFRICRTCNQWHQALHSIGTLQCKFHPMPLNKNCESEWHVKGVYQCCGVSPDPHHPDFDAKFLLGCCAKDHSALHHLPSPVEIDEVDWPSLLTQKVYPDIEHFQSRESADYETIMKKLRYKGIRIRENGSFYLSRIDNFAVAQRRKHKFKKNKRLTISIKLRIINQDNTVKAYYDDLIVENTKTIREVFQKHFSPPIARDIFITDNDNNEYKGDNLVNKLVENATYTYSVPRSRP